MICAGIHSLALRACIFAKLRQRGDVALFFRWHADVEFHHGSLFDAVPLPLGERPRFPVGVALQAHRAVRYGEFVQTRFQSSPHAVDVDANVIVFPILQMHFRCRRNFQRIPQTALRFRIAQKFAGHILAEFCQAACEFGRCRSPT